MLDMISQYSALEARLSYSAPFAASLCCTSGRSRSRRKQLQCSPTRAQDEQSGDGQRKVQSSGPVRVPPLLGPADVRRDTAHILANVTSPEAVEEAARQKFLGRLAVVLLGVCSPSDCEKQPNLGTFDLPAATSCQAPRLSNSTCFKLHAWSGHGILHSSIVLIIGTSGVQER